MALRVYYDDTTTVLVVRFVALVPKSVAGTVLCFLWAVCVYVNAAWFCVFVYT